MAASAVVDDDGVSTGEGNDEAGLRRKVAVLVRTRDEVAERAVDANPRPEARVGPTRTDRDFGDADDRGLVLIGSKAPHVEVADVDVARVIAAVGQGAAVLVDESARNLGEPEDVVPFGIVGASAVLTTTV